MADRRRRKRKDEEQEEKPTAEETAVGKHLRFNLATKNSNFMGHKVEYFTGSKAVDNLLDSKWASGRGSTDILFTDRNSVVQYLNRLLKKGMFHRALKVVKKPSKEDKKESKEADKESSKIKEKMKAKKTDKDSPRGKADKQEEGTPKAKKKKDGKRKIKLEATDEQIFRDGCDAFVWIYDPIKPMYYVYGLLLVVGAIAVCLFPLWPPWMRGGTYYVSVGGAGLVGSILGLAIVRFLLFALIWGVTAGRLRFWIFPNLLADVGILESFQPTYEYDTRKEDGKSKAVAEDDEAKNDSGNEKRHKDKNKDSVETEKMLANPPTTEDRISNEEESMEVDQVEMEEDKTPCPDTDGSKSSSSRDEFEIIDQEDLSADS